MCAMILASKFSPILFPAISFRLQRVACRRTRWAWYMGLVEEGFSVWLLLPMRFRIANSVPEVALCTYSPYPCISVYFF